MTNITRPTKTQAIGIQTQAARVARKMGAPRKEVKATRTNIALSGDVANMWNAASDSKRETVRKAIREILDS